MIKLQDFAKQQGVTDRAIQKHLKKYEAEFKGLFERKGPNGTWLSDEACELLRSKMKIAPIVIADNEQAKRIKELEEMIERKDVIIERLQQREQEKDKQIEQMKADRLLLEANNAEKDKKVEEAEKALKSAENELKTAEDKNHFLEQENRKVEERATLAERTIDELKNRNLWQRIFNK